MQSFTLAPPEGACAAMVSETYFTRISSTAANPPSTADAIAGVLTGAAVAGAVASSTEYCRIPETCSTYMYRCHAIVSESMSSLIKDAYLDETRKKLASNAQESVFIRIPGAQGAYDEAVDMDNVTSPA